jgi:hypothetical protein
MGQQSITLHALMISFSLAVTISVTFLLASSVTFWICDMTTPHTLTHDDDHDHPPIDEKHEREQTRIHTRAKPYASPKYVCNNAETTRIMCNTHKHNTQTHRITDTYNTCLFFKAMDIF